MTRYILPLVLLLAPGIALEEPPTLTVWHQSDQSNGSLVELQDGVDVFLAESDHSALRVRAPSGLNPRASLPGSAECFGYEVRGALFKPDRCVFATWSEHGGDFELQPDGSLEGDLKYWSDESGVTAIALELFVVGEDSAGNPMEESRGIFYEADFSAP